MSESSKKLTSQVDSDPAIVAPLTNPFKKGKRGVETVDGTEDVGSKKQKIVNGDVEQAVEKKNFETETLKKSGEESSSEEHCSSQSEEQNQVIKFAGTTEDEKRDGSFNESQEEARDDNSKKETDQYLETSKCVEVPPTIESVATTRDTNRASTSHESEEKDEDDNSKKDDQHLEIPKKSDADVEMFDAPTLEKAPQIPITSQATGSKTLLMSNLSYLIKEEDVKNFFKDVGEIAEVHFDVKDDYFVGQGHVEFTTAEAAQEALRLDKGLLLDQPVRLDLANERGGHPTTTSHATGSKTLYLGNLSFSIEEDDVRDFFKDVGEIVAIRFAIRDDRFLGYGHIEFTTAEAAQEALKLNGKEILDRRVKLDLARERGAYTPGSSMEKSNQKGGMAQGKTIFIRGFDSSDGFDSIRSALEKHFGKCGEISRVSIPKDYESGAPKGVAFIDFVDSDGFSQALELDGSDIGGSMITVKEAKKQSGDGREGYGHGGRGWGGSGGGWGVGNGVGGGWGGGSGFSGGRGREYGSGGGWAVGSGFGGGWARDRGTGGDRASGSGYASGRDRESGCSSGRDKGSGYASGRGVESGGYVRHSGIESGSYVRGRGVESGYVRGWGRESGYGGGRGRESGYGGGRGIESGYVSRRHSESGSGSSWSRDSGSRGGWSRQSDSGGGWHRGSGSGGGWGSGSGSGGGWGAGSGRFSGSRAGSFNGSHGSNSRGPSRP